MSTSAVERVFSATAATYDTERAKLIPGFAEFYGSAVSLLPEATDHVLDLGAGTGLLAMFIRERLPDAYLEMIDNSQAMLDRARERFAGDGESVCILGDYTTCAWGSEYDAIVSALSIHHLSDAAKQQIFARILPALKPGGLFINAEQVLQPTPQQEEDAREQWLADVRSLGATEQQIADSLLRQEQDRCATVADQLQWLSQAGFTEVGAVYERGRFAVLSAKRPRLADVRQRA